MPVDSFEWRRDSTIRCARGFEPANVKKQRILRQSLSRDTRVVGISSACARSSDFDNWAAQLTRIALPVPTALRAPSRRAIVPFTITIRMPTGY